MDPRTEWGAKEACEAGLTETCEMLREHIRAAKAARWVEKDEARAVGLFRKACDLGEGDGCNRLGERADAGKGEKRAAAALYAEACKADSDAGCGNLGLAMRRSGKGDPEEVIRLLRKGCDLSRNDPALPLACVELARLLQQGKPIGPGAASAERYAQAACNRDAGEGCYMLASRKGHEAERASFLRLGCTAGHRPSCRENAQLECDRTGTPQACDQVGGGPKP